jgi:hypothetical protein
LCGLRLSKKRNKKLTKPHETDVYFYLQLFNTNVMINVL